MCDKSVNTEGETMYEPALSPIRIGGVEVKNRVARAAHARGVCVAFVTRHNLQTAIREGHLAARALSPAPGRQARVH